MGYKVLPLNFSIGDTGVTQSDDGSGGAQINISANLVPPTGWSVISVLQPSGGTPVVNVIPPTDYGTYVGDWSIGVDFDYGGTYPLAADTEVLSLIAIIGDSPFFPL